MIYWETLHLYSCSRCWQTRFLGYAGILINVTIYFSVLFSLIREKILPCCWKKNDEKWDYLITAWCFILFYLFFFPVICKLWQIFIKNASEELTVCCWPSLGYAASFECFQIYDCLHISQFCHRLFCSKDKNKPKKSPLWMQDIHNL